MMYMECHFVKKWEKKYIYSYMRSLSKNKRGAEKNGEEKVDLDGTEGKFMQLLGIHL
jgi:hypothetical protein